MNSDSVSRLAATTRYANACAQSDRRAIPEEVPVALVHQATTTAVMMATPADLEDFAVGFALTEGLIASPDEIEGLEIVDQPLGREARMWLSADRALAMATRRRMLAGPTGCGLCGVDSLEAAARAARPVSSGFSMTESQVHAALDALPPRQVLGELTRAVHAAGWWSADLGLETVREDVGRHNALDKLVGAQARANRLGKMGALILTSRVSVEMVQKAAVLGAQVVVAISAPTGLALETAKACGMTLVGVARRDAFEVFTHPERIRLR